MHKLESSNYASILVLLCDLVAHMDLILHASMKSEKANLNLLTLKIQNIFVLLHSSEIK